MYKLYFIFYICILLPAPPTAISLLNTTSSDNRYDNWYLSSRSDHQKYCNNTRQHQHPPDRYTSYGYGGEISKHIKRKRLGFTVRTRGVYLTRTTQILLSSNCDWARLKIKRHLKLLFRKAFYCPHKTNFHYFHFKIKWSVMDCMKLELITLV